MKEIFLQRSLQFETLKNKFFNKIQRDFSVKWLWEGKSSIHSQKNLLIMTMKYLKLGENDNLDTLGRNFSKLEVS